ncbi:MAG: hypothetical protein PHD65_06075 [Gallionella sp.]|nr:hypothetical protein [Gallionella sp.]
MTIEQLITLLAGIGTVVSAGVAFWAVLQMKKQRELSYLPDLVISRMFFDGCRCQDAESYFANGWTPSPFLKIEGDEEFVFYLPLRNVGLGTAKNISVAWSFPIEEIVCKLNDLGQKNLPLTHFSFDDGKITIQSESLGNQGLNSWFNQQKSSLEYLLPVTVKSEPVKLEFPILFTQLCSYLFFFHEKNNDPNSMQNFPVIRAHFEYYDIGGELHKTDFDINVLLRHAEGDGRIVSGELEATKLSQRST